MHTKHCQVKHCNQRSECTLELVRITIIVCRQLTEAELVNRHGSTHTVRRPTCCCEVLYTTHKIIAELFTRLEKFN